LYGANQGCSLGLDVSVSRPVFEMSRLVNFVGTSRLGHVSDLKLNVLVSSQSATNMKVSSRSRLGHEGLVYSEHCAKCLVSVSDMKVSFTVNIVLNCLTTFASFLQRFNQLSSLTLNLGLFALFVQ